MNPTQAAFENPYLDTIISLVLVYALLSILVSIIVEGWNRNLKARGVFLQRMVFKLLDDPVNRNYGYRIYQHPIISKMRKDGNGYPHYIPAEGFANALIDSLAEQAYTTSYRAFLGDTDVNDRYSTNSLSAAERAQLVFRKVVSPTTSGNSGKEPAPGNRLIAGVKAMADSELKSLLGNFIERSLKPFKADANSPETLRLDLDKLKGEIGHWFDDYMDRCSGQFKEEQRRKLWIAGFLVAITLNVDSLHLTKVFLLDSDLRERMVSEAERVADGYEAEKQRLGKDTLSTDELLRVAQNAVDSARLQAVLEQREKQLEQLTQVDSVFDAQAEQVLAHVRSWQLPLGWNRTEAPWSWFPALGGEPLKSIPKEFKPSQRALLQHFRKRNRGSIGNFIKWAAGILITSWSLSLGAPFWFEALSKLINIRRSGPKPKTLQERNA